jgi:hypothetical protein
MKFRILEVGGKFTPQYSKVIRIADREEVISFYSFMHESEPIRYCCLEYAKLHIDDYIRIKKKENEPPIIHEYEGEL